MQVPQTKSTPEATGERVFLGKSRIKPLTALAVAHRRFHRRRPYLQFRRRVEKPRGVNSASRVFRPEEKIRQTSEGATVLRGCYRAEYVEEMKAV